MNMERYLRRRVRVSYLTGDRWFEGEVIGYHLGPTLLLRDDEGRERSVSAELPIEIVERRQQGDRRVAS